ncbi:hypothetical protein MN608_01313 [Microdochium nivale]|nr:hypothetical protein MN608_01313 [Microdochium nivale]
MSSHTFLAIASATISTVLNDPVVTLMPPMFTTNTSILLLTRYLDGVIVITPPAYDPNVMANLTASASSSHSVAEDMIVTTLALHNSELGLLYEDQSPTSSAFMRHVHQLASHSVSADADQAAAAAATTTTTTLVYPAIFGPWWQLPNSGSGWNTTAVSPKMNHTEQQPAFPTTDNRNGTNHTLPLITLTTATTTAAHVSPPLPTGLPAPSPPVTSTATAHAQPWLAALRHRAAAVRLRWRRGDMCPFNAQEGAAVGLVAIGVAAFGLL